MNILEFKNLPVFDNMLDLTEPKVGMKFICGINMRTQVETREVGQVVSYYEITEVGNSKNFSYTSRMEKLERPFMED